MTKARGRVSQMNWQSEALCVFLDSTAGTEILTLQFLSYDTPANTEVTSGRSVSC